MNRAPLQSAQVNHNILDQAQPELKQADFISKIQIINMKFDLEELFLIQIILRLKPLNEQIFYIGLPLILVLYELRYIITYKKISEAKKVFSFKNSELRNFSFYFGSMSRMVFTLTITIRTIINNKDIAVIIPGVIFILLHSFISQFFVTSNPKKRVVFRYINQYKIFRFLAYLQLTIFTINNTISNSTDSTSKNSTSKNMALKIPILLIVAQLVIVTFICQIMDLRLIFVLCRKPKKTKRLTKKFTRCCKKINKRKTFIVQNFLQLGLSGFIINCSVQFFYDKNAYYSVDYIFDKQESIFVLNIFIGYVFFMVILVYIFYNKIREFLEYTTFNNYITDIKKICNSVDDENTDADKKFEVSITQNDEQEFYVRTIDNTFKKLSVQDIQKYSLLGVKHENLKVQRNNFIHIDSSKKSLSSSFVEARHTEKIQTKFCSPRVNQFTFDSYSSANVTHNRPQINVNQLGSSDIKKFLDFNTNPENIKMNPDKSNSHILNEKRYFFIQ